MKSIKMRGAKRGTALCRTTFRPESNLGVRNVLPNDMHHCVFLSCFCAALFVGINVSIAHAASPGLWQRWVGLRAGWLQVRFVVDEVALEQVFVLLLTISPPLHTGQASTLSCPRPSGLHLRPVHWLVSQFPICGRFLVCLCVHIAATA